MPKREVRGSSSNSQFGIELSAQPFLLRLRYRALFIGRLRGDQLPCLLGTLLGESCRCYLFDGLDESRDRLAEALDIKGCDEVRQRPLPRLLVVIGELAELFWVQPELTGHLHMRMRQAKSLSSLDPWPQADWNRRLFLRHRPSPECLKRQSMSVAYGESRRSDATFRRGGSHFGILTTAGLAGGVSRGGWGGGRAPRGKREKTGAAARGLRKG